MQRLPDCLRMMSEPAAGGIAQYSGDYRFMKSRWFKVRLPVLICQASFLRIEDDRAINNIPGARAIDGGLSFSARPKLEII